MKGLNNKLKGFKSGSPARIYAFLRDHHKDSADSPIGVLVSYIKRIDRTLYRPREIIQFCAAVVEENTSYGTFPIDYDVISKAELTYSEDRTKDIASEYRFQYPGLMNVFEIFRGKTYTFDRDELEFLCLQLSVGEHAISKEAESWIHDQDPSFIIETLWRIGFLRAQAVGGVKAQRRSGRSYLGPHQVPNLSLRGVWKERGLKNSPDRRYNFRSTTLMRRV
jgi:hypothetical protein